MPRLSPTAKPFRSTASSGERRSYARRTIRELAHHPRGNTPAGLQTACVFALRCGCTERMLARPLVDFRRRRLPLACTCGARLRAIKSRREGAMTMTDYAFCKGLEYP